jgi:hypothetical protein
LAGTQWIGAGGRGQQSLTGPPPVIARSPKAAGRCR